MKKLLRKVMVFTMVFALAFTLAACGSGNAGTPDTTASGGTAASTAGKETAPDGGKITITFWHSLGASVSGPIITKFIETYEAEHPNIDIVEDSTQSEDYQYRKLKVAVANGSQGDVFHSYGAGYSRPFVDAGAVLPLDSYFEADGTLDRLQDGVLDYMTYDGKVYGLPLTKWAGVLFCNTDFFTKYNVEYPQTWDQLMTAVKTFRDNGITPMALGGKDAWHVGLLQNALAVRTAGADYCNKSIVGEATLDVPEIVQSAKLLQDLADAKAFDPGVLGLSYDEVNMEFNLGNIPMYYNGSWLAGEVENPENKVKGKIKVMPLPTVDGGKGDATQFLGGATACYMINSKSKHPDEAVAFAIALAEHQAGEAYKAGDDVTCWRNDIPESEINPVLLEINKLTESATGYVLAWDTFLVGTAIDAHYDLLQETLGETITPEQFAKKMEEAKAKALAENETSGN